MESDRARAATAGSNAQATAVTTSAVLQRIAMPRNLFQILGFDVRPFTDEQIAAAIMGTCRYVRDEWPSNEEIAATVRALLQSNWK